jgi:pimeloyl-ACP methyl ester carboxylesterase
MPVTRRLALVFPGFEPIPVEAHCARFIREAKKNAPVYDMAIETSEIVFAREGVSTAAFTVHASGEDWRTDTEIVLYGLGDLNEAYARRGGVLRTLAGLAALADFMVTGTFFRFVRTSWRYGFFFLYPVVLLLAGLLIGVLVARFMPGDWEFRSVSGLVAFVLALWLASTKMHFLLMMDDWACARDIARGGSPDIGERIGLIESDMRRRIETADVDEILLAAHSFGSITAVLALEFALRHGQKPERIGLLTTGSSLLKVALHPAAAKLREAVVAIIANSLTWIDVQSLTDPINFYGSDPKKALGITAGKGPRIVRVRFRKQLGKSTYRSIKYNFFRVHRQFVYAAERRTGYSFHAILCGPQPLSEIAANGGLARRWPVRKAPEGQQP